MAHFYLAGPLFTMQDRAHLERLDAALTAAGHTVFLPHRDGADDSASRGPEDEGAQGRRRAIYDADMAGLARADGVVALLDGPDCDAGTAFEVGWAVAHRKPVYGLRTDFRTLGPEGPVSVMLYLAADQFLHADGMTWDDIVVDLAAWAGTVKPFGGRLVRDAVPRLAKERGESLAFRKADSDERPVLFKNKIRVVAEELVHADRGGEPEMLADLLEATEAFIRDRGYDRETLKAVKAGKWKTRGGYEEAWIVDGHERPAPDVP